ncbi:MAG TPA: hypothetical protein ENO22_01120 [candidate division Zixibacteria bacterium]|nr:hypothetical protein [candidate division Zixibacteria bacterium]
MKARIYFLLAMLGILLISCNVSPVDSMEADDTPLILQSYPSFDVEEMYDTELLPIDDKLIILIREGQVYLDNPTPPQISIGIYTAREYPHSGYSLSRYVDVSPGNIEFRFAGVLQYFGMWPSFGPAVTSQLFAISNGDYTLRIKYQFQEDLYNLKVTDEYIRLIPVDTNFTEPRYELYWRYVPGSFAYICKASTEMSYLCDYFADTLLSEIDLEEFYYPDSGWIPYERSWNDKHVRYFIYESESDYDHAVEILEAFTHDHIMQREIRITLRNWMSERYGSFNFDNWK